MRHFFSLSALITAALAFVPAVASATPIQGQFSVYGTTIQDGGSYYVFDPVYVRVGAGNTIYGSLRSLVSSGEMAAITQIFSYDPYFPESFAMSLGTTRNLTFTMNSLTIFNYGNVFGFDGFGVFTTNVAGFDATPAEMVLTSQGAGNTTFSATLTAQPVAPAVPEPSTLLLLGTGATGLAGVMRRRFHRG